MPRTNPTPRLQKAFGEAIRARRQELGISQEDLGFEAELHRTYISQLERGLKSPSLATIEQLAQVLKAKPSDLIRAAEKLAGR
jgi:transcriptional regulator with XRE-family HTH domain